MSHHRKPTSILGYAAEILSAEAEAILQVRGALGPDFEKAVSLIESISPADRVLLSGIGKTSFIAMKISATLASIGVPSFFLHPAEALHGDLGRYTNNDVALMLSNSGETPEVIKILPHLKRIGCKIISITGEPRSTLGKHSEVVLCIGKLVEAGPLNLAPTSSTVAMMALGDALAMTVFSRQAFSKEQFASYHPGGNLGAMLTPVTEIMRKGDEHCVVSAGEIAKTVLQKMTRTVGRPGAASIVDADGVLLGVFTDGDLRRCLERDIGFLDKPIAEVMTKNPKVILSDELAPEALRLMSEYKIDQIIIVNENRCPIGMVDVQDLMDIGLTRHYS